MPIGMGTAGAISKWALPVAKEAYKNREALRSAWKTFVKLFGRGRYLAVTGMAGAGKTVLFDHLSGKATGRDYKPPGTSEGPEKGNAKGTATRIGLITVPGQSAPARHRANDKIFGAKKAKNAVDGVVHVVCNGFAATRREQAAGILVEKGYKTLAEYRKLRLQEELDDLEDTCGLIRRSIRETRKPAWLVVAVDKLDLYYDALPDAQRRYSPEGTGPFVDKLNLLSSRVGSDNFYWQASPVCGWLENFEWNGEVARSQFGDAERNHYLAQFAETLERCCGRE